MSIAGRLFKILRSNLRDARINKGDSFSSRSENTARDPDPPRSSPDHRDAELAQYYANLEIPYGANLDEAKAAWKRLLKRYHPDLHGNDPQKRETAEALTRGLNHAYKQLEKHLKTR